MTGRTAFFVLVSLAGTVETFSYEGSEALTIGRSEDCRLRLDHPYVSRRHLEVTRGCDGGFCIRDLASHNGTLVNGFALRDAATNTTAPVKLEVGPYLLTLLGSDPDEATVTVQARHAGRARLDRTRHALVVDDNVALEPLSPHEFRLLDALARAEGAVVESRALGDGTWGVGQWDAANLHNLVRRLRRQLETLGIGGDTIIVTVPGVGYRLA